MQCRRKKYKFPIKKATLQRGGRLGGGGGSQGGCPSTEVPLLTDS